MISLKMIEDNTFVIKGLPPIIEPIPDISIARLIYDQLVATCSENPALTDALTQKSISYKELLGKTCTLAECLRRSGYDQNTVISICSENCIEFFIPVLAALYMGAALAPINHNYTREEMTHSLNIARPRIIFCSTELYPRCVKLKQELGFIEKVFVIDSEDQDDSINSFIDRILPGTLLYEFDLPELNAEEHTAFILYSSGTTGLPKGVMITHRNVITKFLHGGDPRFAGVGQSDCIIGYLPFFHAYGLFVCLGSIYKNMRILVIKRFEERLFLSVIEKHKITALPLVPPLAVFLAKSPLVDKYDLSSVKEVGCGAAPLSKDTQERLKKRLNVKTVRQAYGLTESTLMAIGMPIGEEKSGSSGKVAPYMMCKVRDPETGKSLGPNQVGELCLKGALIMKGYYGNEEATRNTFTSDGWLLTGDLGYYDEEEFFFITGRLKELIKYKGYQVAPAELEALLLTNPKINDAAVIGLPDEDAGELPLAFVVPNSGSNLTENEVKRFLDGKVSPHKRLRGGVIFVEEIPKNASGKILRRELHKLVKKYRPKSKL